DHINDDLLVKYLLSETTAGEQEQVKRWLTDEANLAYYNQLKKIWDDSRQLASATTVDENKAWEMFRQNIRPVPARRASVGWMKIAASIVIVAAIGLVAYLALNSR